MTTDAAVLLAEHYAEIGDLLRREADAVIARWAERAVAEQPTARRTHHAALLDHLPRLLQGVATALAEPHVSGPCPQCAPARAHGEQRWGEGWSLEEVVRDYQILRLVLFDHLEEKLGRPLERRALQALDLALDDAVGASVAAYVRARDDRQKRLEASLLARNEELRESDRRKNAFLAMLAHELRNPLGSILNSTAALGMMDAAGPAAAQARDIVERQAQLMVRLVDDLRDVTRLAQGKFDLRRERFELAAAVAQAVQATAPLFEAQRHRLEVHLSAEPLTLEADRARVVQVLVNLLGNAARYTEPGGVVGLRSAREGGQVVLRVRDSGVGIEPGLLPRVFDMFVQAERSLARSEGGLGIGLTLVKQIVELHGGTVEARSEGRGKGREFEVRLPATPADAPAPPPPSAPAARVVRRILLVEDNVAARVTLARLLRLLGHHVEEAADGPAALAQAGASRPEVVLIDISLPGMDGFAVAEKMRQALGPAALLVAVTGHGLDETSSRAGPSRFDAYLAKPVEMGELNRLLSRPVSAP
jgi:signal transduction histidine kinase